MSGLPDSSTGPRSRLRDVHTVPRENLWNSSTSTLSWWADRPAGRVHRPGFTGQGPVSGMVGGTDVPEGLRWFPDRAGTDRRRLEVKGVDEFFPPLVTNLIRLRLAVLIHTDPVGSEGTHHRRDLGPLPWTEGRPGGRPVRGRGQGGTLRRRYGQGPLHRDGTQSTGYPLRNPGRGCRGASHVGVKGKG